MTSDAVHRRSERRTCANAKTKQNENHYPVVTQQTLASKRTSKIIHSLELLKKPHTSLYMFLRSPDSRIQFLMSLFGEWIFSPAPGFYLTDLNQNLMTWFYSLKEHSQSKFHKNWSSFVTAIVEQTDTQTYIQTDRQTNKCTFTPLCRMVKLASLASIIITSDAVHRRSERRVCANAK